MDYAGNFAISPLHIMFGLLVGLTFSCGSPFSHLIFSVALAF